MAITYPIYRSVNCQEFTAAVTGGSTTTVIKATPGVLGNLLVTASGTTTASVTVYDSNAAASGTIIGITDAANVAVGSLYTFNLPASNGIVVSMPSGGPNVTISYS